MMQKVDLPDRVNPGEYINRVKQTDKGHAPAGRDFAYAIEEMTREGHKKHHSSPEFGEDTYEPAADDEEQPDKPKPKEAVEPDSTLREDRNLDITV